MPCWKLDCDKRTEANKGRLKLSSFCFQFYSGTLGVHWPSSRLAIDDKYNGINPPFAKVERFEDAMHYELNNAGILDYVRTWSALQVAKKSDPNRDWLKEFREEYVVVLMTLSFGKSASPSLSNPPCSSSDSKSALPRTSTRSRRPSSLSLLIRTKPSSVCRR